MGNIKQFFYEKIFKLYIWEKDKSMGIETIEPISGNTKTEDILIKRDVYQLRGTVKTDLYWTGDNKSQSLLTIATPAYKVDDLSFSAAFGEDRCLDTPVGDEKKVIDIYMDKPLLPNLTGKMRLRTKEAHGDVSTQLRYGLQTGINLSENDNLYAQIYGANNFSQGGKSRPSVGLFAGWEHKFNNKWKFYLEEQVYDKEIKSDSDWGINAGLRYSFGSD